MEFRNRFARKAADLNGAAPVTAAFLGDSVTQGCFEVFRVRDRDLDTVYDAEAVYHSHLKKELHRLFPRVPVNMINAGISGGSAPQGADRIERDVLRFSPDLVVVCFGLNDVHGGQEKLSLYSRSLERIFDRLHEASIETVFMTPNMMNTQISPHICDPVIREYALSFSQIQNSGLFDVYMEEAKRVCDRAGVPVCDVYSRWKAYHAVGVDVTELLSNYLNHPTRAMHELFSHELLRLLF